MNALSDVVVTVDPKLIEAQKKALIDLLDSQMEHLNDIQDEVEGLINLLETILDTVRAK